MTTRLGNLGSIEDDEEVRSGFIPGVRAWWTYYAGPDSPFKEGAILRAGVTKYMYPGPVVANDDPPDPNPVLGSGVPDQDPKDKYGFYAFRDDEDRAISHLRGWFNSMDHCLSDVSPRAPKVFGQVSLFGTVVVHEEGYRAQKMRIDRLWVVKNESISGIDYEQVAEDLERRYRVQVTLYPSPNLSPEILPELVGG